MAPAQRAIAVFEAPLNGRRTYFLAQLRFTFPSRDRMTSFVALRVDAERLRTTFIPQLRRQAARQGRGTDRLSAARRDGARQRQRVIFPAGGSAPTRFVDERTFPLVFYEADLTQLTAPDRHDRRNLARAHRLRRSDDPRHRRRPRPAAAGDDGDARRRHGARRVLRRARRGARGARRGDEVELRVERLARSEDAARADPAVRRDARARPPQEHRPRAGVLPHHQQRGAQADAADQQSARLLEDRGRAAQLQESAGRSDRVDPRRARLAREPVPAQPVHGRRRGSTTWCRC